MSQITVSPITTVVNTDDTFAKIQRLARKAHAEFHAQYPHLSFTYEEMLTVYVRTWTEAGCDLSGCWPGDDFDAWVNQHEADFGDMADYQASTFSGIPMM